jgi:hypothetical protein
MTEGFIYVLKNPHMLRLVKIGYTDRSPRARASELSNHTGVPGDFSVVKSWRIQNAATYEKKIFAELFPYRKAGEHFELSPSEAVKRINVLLRAWGQIGDDGLTQVERAEALQRQRKLEEAEKVKKIQEFNKHIEFEIQESQKVAANMAWEACAPARKKRRIKSAVIWSIICLCGALVLSNWEPASERSEQTYRHAINFALFIWLIGTPFVWLGPTSTPEYEKIKKSLSEAARQGILAKRGLPPTWTPIMAANPSQNRTSGGAAA